MSKIAVVVCPNIRNFGSVLQSYATQKAVTELGYDNEYINYVQTKSTMYKYFIQLFIPSIMAERKSFLKRKQFQKMHSDRIMNRNSIFDKFVNEYMNSSEKYVGYRNLKKGGAKYDIAVLGSDQVWNPINSGSDFYTLNWLPYKTKRIAYSSSFGVSKIPYLLKNFYKKYLKKFDNIAVREIHGKEIIKELIGKDVPVVCDPTILFKAEQWDEIVENKPIVEGEYIFCYFLGNRLKPRKFVMELAEKTNCKIVMMPYFGEVSEYDESMNAEFVKNPGPSEFVNVIKNAKFICTDSFHGTVFSILYKKKFFVFRRHSADSNKNTFSRLESLVNIFGVQDRVVNDDVFDYKYLNSDIDYASVLNKVQEFRMESWNYLKKALEQK